MEFLGLSDLGFILLVTTVVLLLDFFGTVWICNKHHGFIGFLQFVYLIAHGYQYIYCWWGYYILDTELEVLGKDPAFFQGVFLLSLIGRVMMIIDPIKLSWALPSCVGDLMVNIAPCIIYNESPRFLLLSLFQAFVMIIYRILGRINAILSEA